VQAAGNLPAQTLLAKVFTVANRTWRGIGELPASGWRLADDFAEFDAETRFDVAQIQTAEDGECRSGDVLQGRIKPTACPAFGTRCTPLTPLGATMVSGEGACAAYYRYARSRMQPMEEAR
jgi:hydrogenase expression/formation protein HypD